MNRFSWMVACVTLFPTFGCSSSSPDSANSVQGGAAGVNGGVAGAQTVGGGGPGGSGTGGTSSAGSSAGGAAGGTSGSGTGGTSAGGNAGNVPALDPTADVRTLSADDKGVLCDWMNETLGGYGLMTTCAPGMTVSNNPNQSVCVATSLGFQCKVTVQDVETCIQAQAPSHGCDRETSACHQLNCQ
jgi:hypothetical protein